LRSLIIIKNSRPIKQEKQIGNKKTQKDKEAENSDRKRKKLKRNKESGKKLALADA
jgi:hypothetical protein